MKVERTPLTIFDFMGYIFPGFFFLYSLYLILKIDFTECVINFDKSSTMDTAVFITFMLVFSRLVGHIISYFSSYLENYVKSIFSNFKDTVSFFFVIFA